MPASSVEAVGKAAVQLGPVAGLGGVLMRATRVDGKDGRSDAPLPSADAMVVFDIVGTVAEQAVDGKVSHRLGHGGKKVRRVLTGAVAESHRSDQMSGMMEDEGQLGKSPVLFHPTGAEQEVTADVVAFHSRCVDRGFRFFFDSSLSPGDAERFRHQSLESP